MPVDSRVTMRAAPLLELMREVEDTSPDLFGHGDGVAQRSRETAGRMGLPEETIDAVWLAGRLHDVGKAGIDKGVLGKPARLTVQEWQQIRLHPGIGANLLSACELDVLAEWVAAHHERPDGRGYPCGLHGRQIPLAARILAASDAYDAMRTDRVYRAAVSHEQAAEELLRGAGRQFDKEVVATLLEVAEV